MGRMICSECHWTSGTHHGNCPNAEDDDMALEINSYAKDDAIETFTQEQLAHWYCDVDQPPEPKQRWLDGWLRRQSTEDEFQQYKAAFRRYLRLAVRKLDDLWEEYSERMAENDWDAESEVTQECLDAMEG